MKLRHVGCLTALVFAGNYGCTVPAARGKVEVVATSAAALSVAGVTVTVSGVNISPSIMSSLTADDAGWHGTIDEIPPGVANFHGDAFDDSDTLVYAGDTPNVDIVAGQTAVVGLLLQQTQAPPPFQDSAPIIDSFMASSNLVGPGAQITVGGTAHEPGGGTLTYLWTADGGSFDSPGSASTTWTAPDTTGAFNLTFHASDADGLTAAVSFSMSVQNGSATVTTTFNQWPTVSGMTASPTRIDVGDTTNLSVVAADADGDTLSYVWTSSCSGTLGAQGTASPSFTLSALPESGSCTFVSAVSDGRGGSNTGTVTLEAGPAPTLAICPATFGGSVDQSSYGNGGGDWEGVQNNTLTNGFTVGRAGTLTGIEVQVYRCDSVSESSVLNMQVFDGSNNSLGTATLTGAALMTACTADVVSASAPGPGLFDLTSSCISATQGESVRYTLSLSGGTPGTCDRESRTCSNGGPDDRCEEDMDCQQMIGLSMAPRYDGNGTFLGDAFVFQSYVE